MIKLVNSRLGRQNVLDVVNGLLMGKMSYLLAHCFGVRLEEDNGATGRAKKLQVLINDAARLVTRRRRSEHVKVADLLDDAKLPTVNKIVVRESAMSAWNALSPHSGGSPLSETFETLHQDGRTRGASSGVLRMPDDDKNVLIKNAATVWNRYPDLRAAKSLSSARSYIMRKIWPTIPV